MAVRLCPFFDVEHDVRRMGPNNKYDVLLIQRLCKIIAEQWTLAEWNSRTNTRIAVSAYPETDGIFTRDTEMWIRTILYVMAKKESLAEVRLQGGGFAVSVGFKAGKRPAPDFGMYLLNRVAQEVNLTKFLELESTLHAKDVVQKELKLLA